MSSAEMTELTERTEAAVGARGVARWLFYGQALLAVVTILIRWQQTGRLDLNLNFLFLIWCGYAIAQGSRGAVNWGMFIAGISVIAGGMIIYCSTFHPTALHEWNEPLTPTRLRTAFIAGIESTLWGLIVWLLLRVVCQREEISFKKWFDFSVFLKVVMLLGLIVVIIAGLFWLDSQSSAPLADELPITNSQTEQIEILRQRYGSQIEFLKEVTLHPEMRQTDDYEQRREELLGQEPGIIDGSFEIVSRDGVHSGMEGFNTNYRELSFTTIPGYYPKGSITLDSGERYRVIEYSDYVQNDEGVWLRFELIVRLDHLQETELDFE